MPLLPAVAVVTTALLAGVQEPVRERPVAWTMVVEDTARPAPGDTLAARLSGVVEDGWYVYAPTQPAGGPFAMEIRVDERGAFRGAGSIDAPAADTYPDRNFNIFSKVYEGRAAFRIPVRVSDGALGPTARLAVLVRYQSCNDRYCLPPRTDTVAVEVALNAPVAAARSSVAAGAGDSPVGRTASSVAGQVRPPDNGADGALDPGAVGTAATARGSAASAAVPDGTGGLGGTGGAAGAGVPPRVQDAAGAGAEPWRDGLSTASAAPAVLDMAGRPDSLVRFLWLAAAMGLLSLLTPCVFPLVPITVGYFAKGAGRSRRANLVSALAYAVGIVVTFSALGLAIALLFGAGGIVRFAANPWVNVAVAALFVAFALSLLGVWTVSLPTGLTTRAAALGSRASGIPGAVLMGGTFTLTSFTCTAPLVGTLLVVAAQGSWRWPLLGLAVYAAAFALPFFLLALVPEAMSRLPRSGPWMTTLKAALGILELAAAVKFLSNADMVWHWGVLTRDVVIALWTMAALALAGLFVLGAGARRGVRPTAPRAALAALALGVVVWLSTGLGGARLGELEAYLPPRHDVEGAELAWRLNDYEGTLASARLERRPILVDFTGYTCTNCRWMEANMFPRPEVRALLEGFERVRLYTDGVGDVYTRQQVLQQRMFGTVALPYYAVITPDGTPVATFLGMTREPAEFVRFLELGLTGRGSPSAPARAGL